MSTDASPRARYSSGDSSCDAMEIGEVPSKYDAHHPDTDNGVMVFFPTMEEFRDFPRYIKMIENVHGHESSGVAKIVPPPEWHPRPSRRHLDYADADDYEISEPVREKISGDKGCYTKFNTVVKQKMKVKEFREIATSKAYEAPSFGDNSLTDIDRAYWRATTIHEPIYGADTPGSMYDDDVKEWNVNGLGTILDLIDDEGIKIKGVNTAYLYFGMWKTTFPWHVEDVDLYSINYLHYGAPKYWYGIAEKHADRLESVAKQYFAESYRDCKVFLRHKMYLLSPSVLNFNQVPFGRCIQRAGEFMITFARGYHAGFNLGYNCAESTNFASERWVPIGAEAKICHCRDDSVQIDMHPFMAKYRPYEYADWAKYYYGDDVEQVNTGRRKMSRAMTTGLGPKKTNSNPKVEAIEPNMAKPSSNEKGKVRWTNPRADEWVQMLNPEYKDDQSARDLWRARTSRLWSCQQSFFANERKFEPYCAVCAYFTPLDASTGKPRWSTVGVDEPAHHAAYDRLHSRRLVNDIMFVRDPEAIPALLNGATRCLHSSERVTASGKPSTVEAPQPGDTLLRCSDCAVCVHSACVRACDQTAKAYLNSLQWKCHRCTSRTPKEVKCRLCVLRGGVLVPCSDMGYVHIVCALFAVEHAVFNTRDGVDCWMVDIILAIPGEAHSTKNSRDTTPAIASTTTSLDQSPPPVDPTDQSATSVHPTDHSATTDKCGDESAPCASATHESASTAEEQAPPTLEQEVAVDETDVMGVLPKKRRVKPTFRIDGNDDIDDDADCFHAVIEHATPYNCYLCRVPRGFLVPCSQCPSDNVSCVHATCGLHMGVRFEQKDWPLLLALTCTQHGGQSKKDLRALNVGESVIAWLDKGVDVQRASITKVHENVFCVVDFLDGTSTDDSYMSDIKTCDCKTHLGRPCEGKHVYGAHVTVVWEEMQPDGRMKVKERHTGEFQRARSATTYSVRLADGGMREMKREELYASEEVLPDIVKEKLALRTDGDVDVKPSRSRSIDDTIDEVIRNQV